MRFIKGSYKITGRFGEPYAADVLKDNPVLLKSPWFGKCIALEWGIRPYDSAGELLAPIAGQVVQVGENATSGKFVRVRVHRENNPFQSWVYTFYHLGKPIVTNGQWVTDGQTIGFVGGTYGWTGKGTGAHSAVTFQHGKSYVDPQPLWDWQPPPVAPKPSPTITPISPPDAVLPPEPTPTPIQPGDSTIEEGGEAEVRESQRFTLNREDLLKWGKNLLVFAGPALLILIASTIKEIPADYKYGVVALYVLNGITDLLKKFLSGK